MATFTLPLPRPPLLRGGGGGLDVADTRGRVILHDHILPMGSDYHHAANQLCPIGREKGLECWIESEGRKGTDREREREREREQADRGREGSCSS